ncbi:MAG TPA: ubiquinol-cytochrome c reductase iron-sulfur subunit [Caulobacteraceae bacterium]|nr:ubiquinol-cytochrome c reductase iron-sulfur subunit [Caulobacteraceae bacterium]
MWRRADPDRRALLAAALAAPALARAAEVDPRQYIEPGGEVDVSGLARGDWLIAVVDDQPVFVRRRTPAEVAAARATPMAALRDPARDEDRAPGKGEWLTVSGRCTHAGCTVMGGLGPYHGWMCLCHGSIYDTSGRVRSGPAPRNLAVVPHRGPAGRRLTLAAA